MSTVAAEALTRIVAGAPAMKELLRVATRLADVTSPVLVEGESGTGKDMVAHFIHYRGVRRDGPFLKIHCPSIPEELLESELFGHEKGAFTDARQAKAGKIELAQGGTIYFDQVQELAPRLCRRSCCAWWRRSGSSASAAPGRSRWTSVSCRRPAPICGSWSRPDASATTSTIA